jgi:aryl-alcohol dehydrogenase-like predicted oxidoreductase
MQTRTLGRTGLEVTTVGFGSITIGGFFGPVDDAESMQALHASVDAGIRFIDTSDAYGAGRSEQIIGSFLRERPDRDQIIICTKGGNNMVTGARNFTPDYIRGCLEGSLKRLGVGVIDVYLLHNPSVQNLKAGGMRAGHRLWPTRRHADGVQPPGAGGRRRVQQGQSGGGWGHLPRAVEAWSAIGTF